MEGCNELGKALCRNTSLVELDVSANRISGAACRRLLAGLRSNATLRCLRVCQFSPFINKVTLELKRRIYIFQTDPSFYFFNQHLDSGLEGLANIVSDVH